jgi:hypothetical protein
MGRDTFGGDSMPLAKKLLSAENDGDALALRFLGVDGEEFELAIDPDTLASTVGMLVAALARMPAGAAKATVPPLAAPKQVHVSVVPGQGTPAALLLACGPLSATVSLPRGVMAALRDHLSAYLAQPPSQAS